MPIQPVNSGRIDPARIDTDTAQQPESSRSRPTLEGNPSLPSRTRSTPIRRSSSMVQQSSSPEHEQSALLRGQHSNSERFDLHAERVGGTGLTPPVSSLGGSSIGGSSRGSGSFHVDPSSISAVTPEWLADAKVPPGADRQATGPTATATPDPTRPPILAIAYPGYGPGERFATHETPAATTPPLAIAYPGYGPGEPFATHEKPAATAIAPRPDLQAASHPSSSQPKADLDPGQRPGKEIVKHIGPTPPKDGTAAPASSPSSSDDDAKVKGHKRELTQHDLEQVLKELEKLPQASAKASTSGHGGTEKPADANTQASTSSHAGTTKPAVLVRQPSTRSHGGTAPQSGIAKTFQRLLSVIVESQPRETDHASTAGSSIAEGSNGRSMGGVAGALLGGLGSAARVVGNQAALTASVLPSVKVDKNTLKVIAGHALHQTVAVGIPTVIREFIAQGVKIGLTAAPPHATFALQASMTVVNMGLQVMREKLEQRRPEIAAQGYHSMTAAEWETRTPAEQGALMLKQRQASRTLTALQFMSSMTNMALTIDAMVRGDRLGAASLPAGEVKTLGYTTMRDFSQASFRMVDVKGEMSAGLHGSHHAASAGIYTAMNVGASTLGDALKAQLVPEQGLATKVLTGLEKPSAAMDHAGAWAATAKSAAIGAGMNIIAETTDWYNRTEQQASMTGARQEWSPKRTGEDYARLLDQTPGRMALINTITSGINAVERAATHQPAAMQEFLGNATLGVIGGMLDSPIQGLWQAAEAVRGVVKKEAGAGATADTEMGVVNPSATTTPPPTGATSPTSTDAGTYTSGRLSTANSARPSRVHSTLDQRPPV